MVGLGSYSVNERGHAEDNPLNLLTMVLMKLQCVSLGQFVCSVFFQLVLLQWLECSLTIYHLLDAVPTYLTYNEGFDPRVTSNLRLSNVDVSTVIELTSYMRHLT